MNTLFKLVLGIFGWIIIGVCVCVGWKIGEELYAKFRQPVGEKLGKAAASAKTKIQEAKEDWKSRNDGDEAAVEA